MSTTKRHRTRVTSEERGVPRRIAALIAVESAALAVMAILHLTGTLAGGSKPFDPKQAGVVEAIICVVLVFGAGALTGEPPRQRMAAVTLGLSILGFVVGLVFTVQGGDAIDLAFHATLLPLLILTLLALLRRPTPTMDYAKG